VLVYSSVVTGSCSIKEAATKSRATSINTGMRARKYIFLLWVGFSYYYVVLKGLGKERNLKC